MENRKKRIEYIDVARGIAIVLMIIGHCLELNNPIRKIIFSFHMPLFIIISGYFYRDDKIIKCVKNILKKLVIPYASAVLILCFIKGIGKMSIIDILENCGKSLLVSFSFAKRWNYSIYAESLKEIWFIPMLSLIRIFFLLIKRICSNNEKSVFLIVVLSNILGYTLGIKGYWLPFSCDVALVCILFYYFGYVLKKYEILDKLLFDWKSLIIILLIWIMALKIGFIELAIRHYPNGLISFVEAIAGSIIILKLSNLIHAKLKILSEVLVWLGKNSLYVLIIHYLEQQLINYNKSVWVQNVPIIKIYYKLILIIISTYVCEKFLNFKNELKSKK